MRIFSLNYDLCFEHMKPQDTVLETGFDGEGVWNSFRFERYDWSVEPAVYLYKLHGSINWYRDKGEGNVLRQSVHPTDEPELIFGTEAKLQSTDPYLFYVYQFRQYLLESKLVVVLGYSFNDMYINTLLKQALEHRKDRALLVVDPTNNPSFSEHIKATLGIESDRQIIWIHKTARDFLVDDLTVENIEQYFLKSVDDVF